MTTETPGYRTPVRGVSVLGPLLSTGLVGLAATAVGSLISGTSAAAGAAIGAVMVCLFFGSGAVVLGVAARLAPQTSLLIALMTYVLKVVAVGVVFAALARSGALDASIDPRWLGSSMIVCTLVWLTAQVTANLRSRQLAYDLPGEAAEANAR